MKSVLFFVLFSSLALAQTAPQNEFIGVKQFDQALRSFDATMLKSLYSTNPPAASIGKDKTPHDIADEINFWEDLRKGGLKDLQILQRESGDQQGMHVVGLTFSFKVSTPDGDRTRYVLEDQGWQQQGSEWKIVVAKHSDVVKFAQPMKLKANLYAPNVDARAEIKEAVAKAKREHKRVILVFGANWCYDCHVLDFDLHQPDIARLADPNFVLAHIDIGDDGKLNNDLAKQYQVPLEHGVPALAVLDGDGKLVYSQQHGEFEAARTMDPDNVVTFLTKWKP
jgi:thioredoxin 1